MVVMANTVAVAANMSSFPTMAMATQKPLLMLSTSCLPFPARLPISPTRFPSASFLTAAVSSHNAGLNSSDLQEDEKKKKIKYYFVVANAKFMLDEEEHFKEQMFERLRMFGERNLEQDFWLVIEPKFLDKFPNIAKRLRRPAVALVSTNGPWITFMKLRLDRVLSESYEADSLEQALASEPTEIQFDKPDKWVAPYPKYEYGWWEAFLPTASHKSLV